MKSEPSLRSVLASAIRSADDIVIAKLRINEGVPSESLSRFGDDI